MRCVDRTNGMGYVQAHDWLEWMSKRYEQHQCEKCKLWHIWKRKSHRGLDESASKGTPTIIKGPSN